MSWLAIVIRRSLWVVLVSAAGGATYAWWRDRSAPEVLAPAEWPPLTTPAPSSPPVATRPIDAPHPDPGAVADSDLPAAVSFVNDLVDAPVARSADNATGGWAAALNDGSCPIDHPIKANNNSGIFHVPGGRFYNRTKPERCYSTPDAAIADGYRQAKN
jgi:hypothetical protein